ncbi:SCO6745 family protein [Streptomyces sp. NPDC001233]
MSVQSNIRLMDKTQIGNVARVLQTIPAMAYFAPETEEELTAAGLEAGVMCYLGGRAAPMGAVSASVVHAVFYTFNPERVRRHIPKAWSLATPATLVEARFVAADRALNRMLGAEVITSPEVAEAAELARRAASSAATEGRPLAGSHQELDWPTAPHLVLWHGLNILREHRGDGHMATLLNAGLSGLQALVSNAATGRGFLPSFAQSHRGWSEEQWDTAVDELRERGVLDAAGGLTKEGSALRAQLEEDTDRSGAAPWRTLGADGIQRLADVGGRLTNLLLAAGCLPSEGVFFPVAR